MGRTRDERRIGGKTSSALARVAPESDQDRYCRSELKGRDRPSGEKVTDESSWWIRRPRPASRGATSHARVIPSEARDLAFQTFSLNGPVSWHQRVGVTSGTSCDRPVPGRTAATRPGIG